MTNSLSGDGHGVPRWIFQAVQGALFAILAAVFLYMVGRVDRLERSQHEFEVNVTSELRGLQGEIKHLSAELSSLKHED